MPKATSKRQAVKVTLRVLNAQMKRLQRRVEDLEDLRDLRSAMERNAGKPGIPWNEAKKQLGL